MVVGQLLISHPPARSVYSAARLRKRNDLIAMMRYGIFRTRCTFADLPAATATCRLSSGVERKVWYRGRDSGGPLGMMERCSLYNESRYALML